MADSLYDFTDTPKIPKSCDILVVGSGAAGLYAALRLPSHYQVCLITKDTLKTGASDWAQGGIAAAVDPSDSPQLHFEDTLKAGAGLCDPKAVKFLVEQAPQSIKKLVELGVSFDRKGDNLAMTLEAAHSRPRVLHAADTTGRAIISTLTEEVLKRPNIQVMSQAVALSLWLNPSTGRCQGISCLYHNQIGWLKAGAVILSTGGGGQVYAQTTNPTVSTGDGVALAWRAGAIVRDLEFVQFHPTALTKPLAPHFLISEAVRGEGAYLVDHQGERFAYAYHESGELAPRDVVSRAIFSHLQKTASDPANANVYLDLRSIEPERIQRRFPNIIRVCQQWGIDVFTEPIPVAPAAHYWMGGIATDLTTQTSIKGLYAIGETASTGVHGANRLASNSLLECIVFSDQLPYLEINATSREEESGRQLLNLGKPQDRTVSTSSVPQSFSLSVITDSEDGLQEVEKIKEIRSNLPILMWQNAAICRSHDGLQSALTQVIHWREELATFKICQYLLNLTPNQNIIFKSSMPESNLRICAETLNLLDIAYLILKSALFRTESRGGHYRIDYPETSSNWQVHTLVQGEQWWTSSINP